MNNQARKEFSRLSGLLREAGDVGLVINPLVTRLRAVRELENDDECLLEAKSVMDQASALVERTTLLLNNFESCFGKLNRHDMNERQNSIVDAAAMLAMTLREALAVHVSPELRACADYLDARAGLTQS